MSQRVRENERERDQCHSNVIHHMAFFSLLWSLIFLFPSHLGRDFPGSPVVKISLSNAAGVGRVQFQVGELRSYMPCSRKTKTQNRINIVTNSIDFKNCPHQKSLKNLF